MLGKRKFHTIQDVLSLKRKLQHVALLVLLKPIRFNAVTNSIEKLLHNSFNVRRSSKYPLNQKIPDVK